MGESPTVCVVMLTHNGSRHLAYALPSLRATEYSAMHVLVVDNGSAEDVAPVVEAGLPESELVRSARNLMWAGGNNLGIRRAIESGAEYVALVNDDVLFHPRWLAAGVAAFEAETQVAVVGFRMLDDRLENSREAFDAAVAEPLPSVVPGRETGNVSGAAMLVKTAVFEAVGLFDETYGAYCEENDFEDRCLRAGYRMVQVDVPIWHAGGGSFGRVPFTRAYLSMRNIIRYGIKNRSLGYSVKTAAHVLRVAATPLLDVKGLDRVARRYRPGPVPVNLGLLVGAMTWNVLHLPGTLAARQRDDRRVAACRRVMSRRQR